MISKRQTFTFQTRLKISESEVEILDACASHFNYVERKLFADISSGLDPHQLKASYITRLGITARHYNACRIQLQGKIAAYKASREFRIASLEHTLEKLKKKKSLQVLHQKKRRLHALNLKLKRLIQEKETNQVRLCFGSKKLFHAQFHLNANGYHSHEEWKADWQQRRSSSFFLLGSKDETSGNQSCTATLQEDGTINIRLRLPDFLKKCGKYVEFHNLHFHNGHKHFLAALQDCIERNSLKNANNKKYLDHGQAICYRFYRDVKGWRLFASFEVQSPATISSKALGTIGIDINANHLALSEVDRFGNPIEKLSIPLVTYGKSRNQSKALIGEASKLAVSWAEKKKKPIVLETLDFSKKKASLKEATPKYARMLSSFAYESIIGNLQSRAYRNGIEVMRTNPAYTSVIGRVKFAKKYGLSNHHAAGVSLARRALGVSERLPRLLDKVPNGKGGYVALHLPARNRGEHVWSQWSVVNKSLQAALAAQSRETLCRSSSPPKAACVTQEDSRFAGEIPASESSIQRLD